MVAGDFNVGCVGGDLARSRIRTGNAEQHVGKMWYVGGIAFVVPDKVEIAATTAHFVAWLAVGAAVRLRGSPTLEVAAAAVLYAA